MAYNVFTWNRQTLEKRRGFALVAVLMLAVLLTLVVVALFSLLNVETQSGGNVALRNQARQNALTSLDLALGEVQKNLGPDQRISAPATLLDSNAATPEIENVAQAHWVGVWKSAAWIPNTPALPPSPAPPDYTGKFTKSKNIFLRWLVSSPEDKEGSPNTLGTDVRDPNLPKGPTLTDLNSVILVGANTVKPSGSQTLSDVQVKAWKITGDKDNAGRVGSYAWWVGDEGLKAKVNMASPYSTTPSDTELQASLASAPRTALEAVAAFASVTTTPANLTKTITYSTLPLAYNGADFTKAYYDYTVLSRGVLSDTQNGGLKKDLSLLLELPQAQLPATIYSGAYKKVYSRVYGAETMGPDWGLIYRYYNLYKSPYLYKDTDGTFIFYMDRYNIERQVAGDLDFISFQTLRAQYLFGFFQKPADIAYELTPPAPASANLLYMTCYPLLQVWNPYNIRLRSSTTAENTAYKLPSNTGAKTPANVWSWPIPPLSISFNGSSPRPFVGSTSQNGIFQKYAGSMWTTWLMSGNFFQTTLNPGAIRFYGIENHSEKQMYWMDRSDGSTPDRAFNVTQTVQFNTTNPPPYSNFLVNDTATQKRVISPASLDFKVTFNTSGVSGNALGRNLWAEGDGQPRYGVADMNSSSISPVPTADTTVSYKSLETGSGIRSITPRTSLSDPEMAFSYSINYKAYPKDFRRISKFNLFSDPLEKSYIILGADAKSAQLAPFEVTLKALNGSPATGITIYNPGQPDHNMAAVQMKSDAMTGYFGDLSDGVNSNIAVEFPTTPLTSMVQLQQVALGRDWTHRIYNPTYGTFFGGYSNATKIETMGASFFNAVGNSYAHPAIAAGSLVNGRSYDHSFYANNALWDSYFFSGIAPEIPVGSYNGGSARPVTRTAPKVMRDFLALDATHKPLASPRMYPWTQGKSTSVVLKDLFSNDTDTATILPTAYTLAASWLMVDGSFNINSTSVDAWTAMLSGNLGQKVPYMPTVNGSPFQKYLTTATNIPFPRLLLPNNTEVVTGTPQTYWNGYRSLTTSQIRTLAENIVKQVKARGPFLSLAEFVNRQVSSNNNLNQAGAIQTAIDASSLNTDANLNTTTIAPADVDSGFLNQTAGLGSISSGSNAFLTQSDILKPIACALAPRSDTFVIRSYGDVADRNGKILSRAWCEAVIQRTPEYMDPSDLSSVAPASAKAVNQNFGRRFRIIQFRWLSPEEV